MRKIHYPVNESGPRRVSAARLDAHDDADADISPFRPGARLLASELFVSDALDASLQQLTLDGAGANDALQTAIEKKRSDLEARRAALIVQRAELTSIVQQK